MFRRLPPPCVAAEPVAHGAGHVDEARHPRVAAHGVGVAYGQLDERRQVVGAPVAAHVGFTRPEVAAQQEIDEEPGIVHPQGDVRCGLGGPDRVDAPSGRNTESRPCCHLARPATTRRKATCSDQRKAPAVGPSDTGADPTDVSGSRPGEGERSIYDTPWRAASGSYGRLRSKRGPLDPQLEGFPVDGADDLRGHQRIRGEQAHEARIAQRTPLGHERRSELRLPAQRDDRRAPRRARPAARTPTCTIRRAEERRHVHHLLGGPAVARGASGRPARRAASIGST